MKAKEQADAADPPIARVFSGDKDVHTVQTIPREQKAHPQDDTDAHHPTERHPSEKSERATVDAPDDGHHHANETASNLGQDNGENVEGVMEDREMVPATTLLPVPPTPPAEDERGARNEVPLALDPVAHDEIQRAEDQGLGDAKAGATANETRRRLVSLRRIRGADKFGHDHDEGAEYDHDHAGRRGPSSSPSHNFLAEDEEKWDIYDNDYSDSSFFSSTITAHRERSEEELLSVEQNSLNVFRSLKEETIATSETLLSRRETNIVYVREGAEREFNGGEARSDTALHDRRHPTHDVYAVGQNQEGFKTQTALLLDDETPTLNLEDFLDDRSRSRTLKDRRYSAQGKVQRTGESTDKLLFGGSPSNQRRRQHTIRRLDDDVARHEPDDEDPLQQHTGREEKRVFGKVYFDRYAKELRKGGFDPDNPRYDKERLALGHHEVSEARGRGDRGYILQEMTMAHVAKLAWGKQELNRKRKASPLFERGALSKHYDLSVGDDLGTEGDDMAFFAAGADMAASGVGVTLLDEAFTMRSEYSDDSFLEEPLVPQQEEDFGRSQEDAFFAKVLHDAMIAERRMSTTE